MSKSPYEDDKIDDDPSYWSLVLMRNTRNSYLNLTDKYLLSDYPISPENLQIIKEYRQTLRDFININKDNIMNGMEEDVPTIPI